MPIISGGGGSGGGGATIVYDSGYIAGAQASIDTGAGGIAGGHGTLTVIGFLRSSAAATSANITLTFNNDGTALYNVSRVQNVSATVGGATVALGTSLNIGDCPAASATANVFGAFWMSIPAYDSTANFKSGVALASFAQSPVGSSGNDAQAFSYQSLAAITRLAITNTGNWVAGSRLIITGSQ